MFEVLQTDEFSRWLSRLKDRKAMAIITDRLLRMQHGNFGDAQPVGEGVSEARIHYGPGYRLYFLRRGNVMLVMLAGGNKSSQASDIKHAKKLADDWR